MRLLALGIALTFALGLSTALAFYAVGGTLAWQGPYVLWHSWPLIYPLVALGAAAVTAPIGFFSSPLSVRVTIALVVVAWIGEYLVLASAVLDDDLNPVNAIYYWLLATGGLLQPVAALLGGRLGSRIGQRSGVAE